MSIGQRSCRIVRTHRDTPIQWINRLLRTTVDAVLKLCSQRIFLLKQLCAQGICLVVIMAALRSRCGHYIFALWFLSIFLRFFVA